ncbi:hypothetical protein WJX84_002255 [Apatococcus fuscideae]|uniref:Uncharacterized protein n=1 Tax=Apatococcus fuscideae TaxID=2026836 RepID=A0AAW1SJ34_9CHLO
MSSALLLCLGSLGWSDRARAACVCKTWRQVLQQPNLWRSLDLSDNQNAGQWLPALMHCPAFRQHLKDLNLQYAVGVTDSHLKHLQGAPLEHLNLNVCQDLTDDGISGLILKAPLLCTIQLYWLPRISDTVLYCIGATCPALTRLNLSGCIGISDGGIKAIAKTCHHLTDIDLTKCMKMQASRLWQTAID